MIGISELEQVIAWLEQQEFKGNNQSIDSLKLQTAKKFSSLPVQYRSLAFDTFIGRKEVLQYYPKLAKGFFTDAGLQQRTHPVIADYHATFFSEDDVLMEIGSGLGFDTIGLAKKVKKIICIENNPVHSQFAKINIQLAGISNAEILNLDFTQVVNDEQLLSQVTAIYADPARRLDDGSRVKQSSQYSPPLDSVVGLAGKVNKALIKLSPVNKDIFPGFANTWVGFQRECKERLINSLGTNDHVTIIDWDKNNSSTAANYISVELSRPGSLSDVYTDSNPVVRKENLNSGYVVFAHPALLASDRADDYFISNGFLCFPEPTKLFFSDSKPKVTALYDSFEVIKILPYDQKTLINTLHEYGWNSGTELKKKNFPLEPETLRRKLELPPYSTLSPQAGVVIFAEYNKEPLMIFAKRVV